MDVPRAAKWKEITSTLSSCGIYLCGVSIERFISSYSPRHIPWLPECFDSVVNEIFPKLEYHKVCYGRLYWFFSSDIPYFREALRLLLLLLFFIHLLRLLVFAAIKNVFYDLWNPSAVEHFNGRKKHRNLIMLPSFQSRGFSCHSNESVLPNFPSSLRHEFSCDLHKRKITINFSFVLNLSNFQRLNLNQIYPSRHVKRAKHELNFRRAWITLQITNTEGGLQSLRQTTLHMNIQFFFSSLFL